MDLYVVRGFSYKQTGLLYRNNGNTNNWLKLKLIGTVSNRSAIGATVRLLATIRGKTFWQRRDLAGGGIYFSQDDLRANFGLANAMNADTVRIEWPSGTVQELHNVAAKQILTVTEPPKLQITRAGQVQIRCWQGMQPRIEVSTNLVNWSSLATLTVTNITGTTVVEDTNAATSPRRFYRAVLP
jgi:hypothetical protein